MNNSTAKAKPKMTVKNGVVYGDALSAQEKKRIVMQKKKDRKAKKVRKSAQQTIPYVEMCRDGICKVNSRLYTKSIAFEDINYQLAQNEDKTAIFENWCDFLNYFDSSIFVQLSFINQKASLNEFRKRINIPAQEDAFNDIRSEYSGMLQSQLTKGNNGLVKKKYITFGIEADSLRTAKPKLERMEQELQHYLDTYESTHNYDEYHFDLDDIEHDPYVLISILSALHEGEFTLDEVQGTLQMLFEKQYILTEEVIVETRYRTETDTWTDADGNTHTETYRVPYDYYICNVKLENFNLSHVPVYIMSQEQLSMYATYMSVLGNREDLFGDSPYVDKYITNPPADYDVNPEYLNDEKFATLITEAEKYLGYPYVWGGSNPDTSFDCSGFVSYVLTNSGLVNTGRLGAQGLYNVCTPVSKANAQPGDLIFFVGTYDTPGVSHVGIYVGDGVMIHCGDPIQYTSINSSYWQQHFYAFGRPAY